jgi:hypothetical protein
MEPEFLPRRNRSGSAYNAGCPLLGDPVREVAVNRIGALVVLLMISPGVAGATGTAQGQAALARWKSMDLCARQAQKSFPDYTAESNAKREAALRACLANSGLPPRAPAAPLHPATGQ